MSWSEARDQGLKRYFTGVPCKYGHVTERFVSNHSCIKCLRHSISGRPARRRAEHKCRMTTILGREKMRRARIKRLANEAGAQGFYTAQDINNLMIQQNGRCIGPSCDADFATVKRSVDHKTPLSRGGSNWPINLQLLCISCNCSKKDKTDEEWRAK